MNHPRPHLGRERARRVSGAYVTHEKRTVIILPKKRSLDLLIEVEVTRKRYSLPTMIKAYGHTYSTTYSA